MAKKKAKKKATKKAAKRGAKKAARKTAKRSAKKAAKKTAKRSAKKAAKKKVTKKAARRPAQPKAAPPPPEPIAWNEVYVGDVAAANSFYTQLMGWKPNMMKMGDMEYPTLEFKGRPFAGIIPQTEGMSPVWLPYFNVDNVDATVQRASAMQARVTTAPMDIPGGRIAILIDPQGVSFGIYST